METVQMNCISSFDEVLIRDGDKRDKDRVDRRDTLVEFDYDEISENHYIRQMEWTASLMEKSERSSITDDTSQSDSQMNSYQD